MNGRIIGWRLVVCACILGGVGVRFDLAAQEKEKNSIKSLFEGVPEDLRSKVKDNAVRRDRSMIGHGKCQQQKPVEVSVNVTTVRTMRNSDGTYAVRVVVADVKAHALENDWQVYLSDDVKGQGFSFVAVGAADAEKLIDSKKITLQGKAKEIKLLPNRPGIGGSASPVINIILEDVRIDGKAFTPPTVLIKSKKAKGK